MQEAHSFPRSLSIGELLDRAFRLYRQNFGLLLLTAAVLLIPFGIVSGLVTGRAMAGYFDVLETVSTSAGVSGADPSEISGPMFSFFGAMFVVGLAGLLLNGAATLALTWQEIGLLHDEKATLGQSLRSGFWSSACLRGDDTAAGIALIGVFLVVAIVFSLITKGHVRRSVIFIILLTLLGAILVTVPTTVISQVAGLLLGSSGDLAFVQSLSMIVSSLAAVIWVPLYTAAFVMLYFDLRGRQTGHNSGQWVA